MTDEEKQPEEEKQQKKRKSRRGHGEGSIYFSQARDEWVGSFYTEDGKRKYVYGKKRSEVYGKLQKAQREDEQGMLVADSRQTMEQYLEHWIEHVHKPKIKESSYINYRLCLDRHIIPALGQIKVSQLTTERLETFYTQKREDGYAARTVYSIHSLIRKALSDAVRRNIIARNPCSAISLAQGTRHEVVNALPSEQVLPSDVSTCPPI